MTPSYIVIDDNSAEDEACNGAEGMRRNTTTCPKEKEMLTRGTKGTSCLRRRMLRKWKERTTRGRNMGMMRKKWSKWSLSIYQLRHRHPMGVTLGTVYSRRNRRVSINLSPEEQDA
jgi:hypothetical protein